MSAPSEIDPTANVLKLVEEAVKRLNDLRSTDDRWAERVRALEEQLREVESRRIDAVNLAESRRLDSVNAETKAAVALASEQAAATARTLATTVTTTATVMNDRMARLEQQQYQTGGRDLQRTEGQQSNRWVIAVVASLPSTFIAVIVLIKLFTK